MNDVPKAVCDQINMHAKDAGMNVIREAETPHGQSTIRYWRLVPHSVFRVMKACDTTEYPIYTDMALDIRELAMNGPDAQRELVNQRMLSAMLSLWESLTGKWCRKVMEDYAEAH